jgi:non-specific serine/threonine protein kinase/serine/threonine-protein kinase
VIGRYHLLQKIGEGGMGEVWLAEQKEPVRRRVALKLIKAGMNSREVIARFESERQALAVMDHPAIARVLDADSTPEGAPYFVMEYVAGVPITTYCDQHRLTMRERLELFIQVCEGVQHAHQKAIIHRDLKPSNILVTEGSGKAAPKIIDFGVAKALTQKLTADTLFTRVGALVGTPEYMSPEQALSSGEDIDTRADVYSLGIILYELLVGGPPIDLKKIAFDEFLRRLRDEDPPKPSTRIRTQAPATSTELAHRRQTESRALAKQMRGDLDSIALKVLEKDRSRRYGTPAELAADIGRYLNNEAVLAVPPSATYRARKFARRHRGGLLVACAFAAVLIAATVVSFRQTLRANREAAVAQAVSDFLQHDLLGQASAANQSGPGTRPDPDLKVRAALDRAAARVAGKFDWQPETEAAIRETIGDAYLDLGLYPEARKQLEGALELNRKMLGPGSPKTLRSLHRLAYLAVRQGRFPEAESLYSQALETCRRVLGPKHRETLSAMSGLALIYQSESKFAQAEVLNRQALDIRRRLYGPEEPGTLVMINNLALNFLQEGKYPEAEALLTPLLETQSRVLGARLESGNQEARRASQ